MKRLSRGVFLGVVAALLAGQAEAQKSMTWDEVRARFEANNPTLGAGQLGIEETKANEISAYLRPNPQLALSTDGTQIARYHGVWQPFAGTQFSTNVSYLHERQRKRELRLESAEKATEIAGSGQGDLERTLLFSLRGAFVSTLQAKAVLKLAKDNLAYWDEVLRISRDRYQVGSIAQIDLDRLELQKVQYESDLQTAEVDLRTAKIQLLALLNERTPIEEFDVTGLFDYSGQIATLEEARKSAMDTRPDLKTAVESVEKAKTDHKLAVANGSTDPTFSGWWTYNPSFNNPYAHETVGASVTIPLRIFDRNQGEKLRTQLDVERNDKLRAATQAQVFSDVDSAHATLTSTVILLQLYKERYLKQAERVRETIKFSYEHGGASLIDFLNAQGEYRTVELSYVNLVGSYLTAAAQLNMAVGREVIQ